MSVPSFNTPVKVEGYGMSTVTPPNALIISFFLNFKDRSISPSLPSVVQSQSVGGVMVISTPLPVSKKELTRLEWD